MRTTSPETLHRAADPEIDRRLALLNTLLSTPHRKLDGVYPIHRDAALGDPLFYVRFAAWHAKHGAVRDHAEAFVAVLCRSTFEGHRDVGLALLRGLEPYRVARVVSFIRGRMVRVPDKKEPQKFGLFETVPRSLRTEVRRYLYARESTAQAFDGMVAQGREDVKRLYATLRIKPGKRAAGILFEGERPMGSTAAVVRQIAREEDPTKQALLLAAHKVPLKVALSIVRQFTPAVLAALISGMTSQEVINSLKMLKRHGAMDNPDLKALIDEKLEAAKTGRRVSALKANVAADVADVDDATREKLDAIANAQVKASGRITRSVALLVDRSGSMAAAIDLAKQIGPVIAAVCEAGLHVVAFDEMPIRLDVEGSDLSAWQRAFRGIEPGGATAIGSAMLLLQNENVAVEEVVLVTDEGENRPPFFSDALQAYAKRLGIQVPHVTIVRCGSPCNAVQTRLRYAGIDYDVLDAQNVDRFSAPNLIPLLSRPSRLDLLMEIMATPLPQRRR